MVNNTKNGHLLGLFGTILSVGTDHIGVIDTFWFKGRNDYGGSYDDDEHNNNKL
jgi:hypothetical protein